jgi:GntR family transcriptional repressor for pyruvate dehydrogenase complex
MPLETELNRRTLSSQIATQLIELVEGGGFSPGDFFLGEQDVSERFNVSRPVVREAFQSLAAQGYISIQKGRRAIVLPPGAGLLDTFFSRILSDDQSNWRHLMDVREQLELMSARLAATNRDPGDIAQLRSILVDMERSINDPEAYSVQDINFHIALAAASGNPYVRYLIESIRRTLVGVLTRLRTHLPKEIVPHVQASHVRIVDAVESRNEDDVNDAMVIHFEIVRDNMEILDESK